MESDDDDIPQLSAETFAALKEFYKEEDDREVLKSEAGGKNHVASCDMNIFSEDWNLSQFWYSEETSKTLAKECLRCVGHSVRKSSDRQNKYPVLQTKSSST